MWCPTMYNNIIQYLKTQTAKINKHPKLKKPNFCLLLENKRRYKILVLAIESVSKKTLIPPLNASKFAHPVGTPVNRTTLFLCMILLIKTIIPKYQTFLDLREPDRSISVDFKWFSLAVFRY